MNISSLKTPGVYVNEIDAFPRSVAQVATAIPAFVGYTEKGPSEPTKIVSMLEFEQLFGAAPTPSIIVISLDTSNLPDDDTKAEESIYNLYNSLQLFYANGGGECYIVSVGSYSNPIAKDDFLGGLNRLENQDEPTLILFPDAVELEAKDLGEVQQAALLQCQKLMDRFVIMDVKQELGLADDCESFRNSVGNNNLKYAAAYYPYLIGNFSPAHFSYESVNAALPNGKKFKDFYPLNANVQFLVELNKLKGRTIDKTPGTEINDKDKLKSGLEKSIEVLKIFGNPSDFASSTIFETKAKGIISSNLKNYLQKIKSFEEIFSSLKDSKIEPPLDFLTGFDQESWLLTTQNPNPYTGKLGITDDADAEADYPKIQAEYNALHTEIIGAVENAINVLSEDKSLIESNLVSQLPLYKLIVSKLSQSINTTPPSGAIAGIYAQTDATRGVWKAPANVSINSISALTDDINDSEQEPMNIHETGKSINAIRKFTGKGFLVWGARTLDGNSNDWRYINVRRLAIMIEESVKKACKDYVYEPNTAQTWLSIKAMIENYLTTVWSDGGLAGAKPEHAFLVEIGLNQTMTAQDILEGRMIVKIGYAPSRPAEFIILEFTQMLQQS